MSPNIERWEVLYHEKNNNLCRTKNFVFSILEVMEERGKSYLFNLQELLVFFNDSLNVLWPFEIFYEKVLVVCTV